MNREQRRQQAEGQRQNAKQGRLSSEQQRHTNEEVRLRLARIPSQKGDNDGNMARIWTQACARHLS
jgi:hypothetical protein